MLLACSSSLMGCILRDFDYQAPEPFPPAVIGSASDPLDRIQTLDRDEPAGGDAGVGGDPEIVAFVRDPDVTEPLQALVFFDRHMNPTPVRPEVTIPVEQDEDPELRRVSFTVPRARFTAGCHKVELHVSSRFVDFSMPRPAIEGDLGVGVWWFAVTDASNPVVDMTTCDTGSED